MSEKKEVLKQTDSSSSKEKDLKSYYCVHCGKFLFRGRVKHLKMACPHCQELICSGEEELESPAEE